VAWLLKILELPLNFRKTFAEQIIEGEKISTRRAKKPLVKVNKAYRIQIGFRYLPERIFVKGICTQRLGDMTIEDAKREGFASLDEFRESWMNIYGFWDDDRQVWVVDFEYIGAAEK